MLIIPVERAVDWRRPPWVTLGLILVNVAVFIFIQGDVHRQGVEAIEAFYHQHGLVPAEITPASLASHQFLHGGPGHLLGNMLMLFLLGFTVEHALGGGRYLLSYLLCGALAALLFAVIHAGDTSPLIGASGAISGLMGMYLTIFGLQKIRFFFFVGVYFDYFRAPALVLLPVWLGKEIYEHMADDGSRVAYLAHAGGLIAGAGLVALFGKSWLQVRQEFFEPDEDEEESRFRRAYSQAMADISTLSFDHAWHKFEALYQRYPERTLLLDHLYQLAKLRPDKPLYREKTREMFRELLRRRDTDRLIEIWREYQKLGESHHPLSAEDHNRVLMACLQAGELKAAERVFDRLRATGNELLREEACRLLLEECQRRELATRVRHYRELLEQGGVS